MEAEIIAVGTELLLGDILNTNAQFLSRELAALGITVHFQTVVGDNPARLESVVRQARGRSDLLVFSGGLGPTEDDLTKQTVARAFGDTLRFDEAELEKIRAFFTAWGRTMPENNKKQAMVPTHGRKIPNANGTAPGMIFEDQAAPGKYAVLLPGPPKELQPMFLNSVKPWLAAMSDSVLHSVTLRVTGARAIWKAGSAICWKTPTQRPPSMPRRPRSLSASRPRPRRRTRPGACVWTMRSIFTISWAIASMPWTRIRWRKWW